MKQLIYYINLLAILGFISCAQSDPGETAYYMDGIPTDNEMVFDQYVSVTPQGNVPSGDTLWLNLTINNELFTDKISGQGVYIPLDQAKFTCQFKITDLIETTSPAYNMIINSGKLVSKKGDLITVSFGYPDKLPELQIGLQFPDIGKYSINFINYPNPDNEEQLRNPCTDNCENYWYDLDFYLNSDKSFEYQAFVEYHFNITDNVNSYDNKDFSNASIYDNAVYTFIVK
ncbi:hypothetical protein ACE1ET_19595 [Saccharicrinis sp. FJH62]|uniref:hypothetical protein n=1 Tax=Saccharicrinis sp. FJH62 TaxID=3344657 RepID=UPI0035D41602